MTTEQGVYALKVWYNQNVPQFNLSYWSPIDNSVTSGAENVYLTNLVKDLIDRIERTGDDPIKVVERYYNWMDDILMRSDDDHKITHMFTGYMCTASHDILNFLRYFDARTRRYE